MKLGKLILGIVIIIISIIIFLAYGIYYYFDAGTGIVESVAITSSLLAIIGIIFIILSFKENKQ